ncbi:alanine--tRNA ligase [Anaerorhabdus furcosa]|uniref:Alanine--tRNA ligase n=1 Tax=Anaerorhabdus furcosa TaxID=118967 RepID=A0A1T4PGW2_9FIRM|nr:alanine--tRNA ligase [Anaerorhabdus furcosa]SJZ90749.1 alanyl-tRNA synthetase [Anaerorhabdus furcosa]
MKQLTGNQVRQMFLDYFASKGHAIEPGASLVPHNDPTLLWINAGVAALKKYFDGSEKPKCNRITNAQKSIRTNDIENVGKTARHHTFFEMLGNFSIGDYFKEEAIQYAWEFLTSPEWIGFDKEKMYITVYPDDEVAYNTWVNICKVDPSHILRTADNFWEIGEGPSGPDSEIFYDRGPKYDPEGLGEKLFFEEMENDRYIEVWNVVFSQYDAKEGVDRKDYKELPQKNIDTGMGLERLVALIQDGETNFDTDLFMPVINATSKIAKHPYEGEYKMAYRVIADHIRTVTFALSDGAVFSNEGRGYVLRRVLRRAVRFGIKLGIQGAFMYQLVPVVADMMEDFYPYLQEKVDLVTRLVKTEEDTFHATLTNGEKLLMEALDAASNTKVLDGEVMFKLYDTYGFPKELTKEIAEEKGYSVDIEGFNQQMNLQKERARNARDDEQSMSSQSIDLMNFEIESFFTGYIDTTCHSKVIACFKDGIQVDSITGEGDIILDQTCFYAESGGQIADTGTFCNDSFTAFVTDVKKAPHKQHLHHLVDIKGTLAVGDIVDGTIDIERRLNIKANHSSLHLLQSALRKVVGTHIAQAGSYVCADYARFDFTHFEKLSDEQLRKIEQEVNAMIMHDNPVITEVLTIDDAKNSGAIALFDEKYGDTVRVVSMGDVSKEFCGGTHVSNTQEIGVFKIEAEESIGSGIRRITSKTKMAAYFDLIARENTMKSIANNMKLNSINLLEEKVALMMEENNQLKKDLQKQNEKMMMLEADETVKQAKSIGGLNVIMLRKENADPNSLKSYAEVLRNKCEDSFVFIANVSDDKVTFVVASSKAAIDKGLKAGDIAKLAASMSGGNGGGRPDLAQSGGKDSSKIDEIFNTIEAKLA